VSLSESRLICVFFSGVTVFSCHMPGVSRGSESIRYPLVRSEEEFLRLVIPRAVPGRQAHIALILLIYLRD
jgi:hypothetical protein